MFRVAELFAGTGAFSLAFEETGTARTVFMNDCEKASEQICARNIGATFVLANIHDLDASLLPDFDILTAGFPCQPFSIAGAQQGFDDARSNVFWKMVEIITVKQPACLVLENVKNLLSHDNGRSFAIIRESITSLGYTFDFKVLNTSKYTDIPQNRERVYIICFKSAARGRAFKWPAEEPAIRAPALLLEKKVEDKFYYTPKSRIWNKLEQDVVKSNTFYQYRRYYVRENKSGVCPTLTANAGSGGHNVPIIRDARGIRKLTPRECFTLQGFSDTYQIDGLGLSNSALYKLAGNAVSVGVVRKLARQVVWALFAAAK